MKHPGSGCGSVGRAVAFDSRGPWFDSSHRQNLIEHLSVNLFANLFIINEHLVKHCRRSMYLHHCLLTNPPNTILRNLLSLCALWHLLKVDWEGQINWLDSCVTYPSSLKCFFKWPFLDTFSLFSPYKYSWQKTNVQYKFCRFLDLNRGPLALEATALPTEPSLNCMFSLL